MKEKQKLIININTTTNKKSTQYLSGKENVLGQFFTKKEVVRKLIRLILEHKKYGKGIRVLEPSFGTGNFIGVLKDMGFINVEGCEIDSELTNNPRDFLDYPISEKFDLIIGNPPFTKYNIEKSYFYKSKYLNNFAVHPNSYLTKNMLKHKKERIENVFISKAVRHLKDGKSAIGFILPISFFIKNRNKEIKAEIAKHFSTIIIYQDSKVWFNYSIPCCFALMINIDYLKDKIVLIYENEKIVIGKDKIYDEIIPQVFSNRKNGTIKNRDGIPLENFLDYNAVKYMMSYTENNVSAKNILKRTKIPEGGNIEDYKLAIVRVGNASVGKCGLINTNKDILNGMFFVLDFKKKYNNNKEMKEKICHQINQRQDYFKNITCRVGARSIKKSDIIDLKIKIQ